MAPIASELRLIDSFTAATLLMFMLKRKMLNQCIFSFLFVIVFRIDGMHIGSSIILLYVSIGSLVYFAFGKFGGKRCSSQFVNAHANSLHGPNTSTRFGMNESGILYSLCWPMNARRLRAPLGRQGIGHLSAQFHKWLKLDWIEYIFEQMKYCVPSEEFTIGAWIGPSHCYKYSRIDIYLCSCLASDAHFAYGLGIMQVLSSGWLGVSVLATIRNLACLTKSIHWWTVGIDFGYTHHQICCVCDTRSKSQTKTLDRQRAMHLDFIKYFKRGPLIIRLLYRGLIKHKFNRDIKKHPAATMRQ